MDLFNTLSTSLVRALHTRAQLESPGLTSFTRDQLCAQMLAHYRHAASVAGELHGYSGLTWLPLETQLLLESDSTLYFDKGFASETAQLHIGLLRILLQQPDLEITSYADQILEPLERSHRRQRLLRLAMLRNRWRIGLRRHWREMLIKHRAGLLFIALACKDPSVERRIRRLFADDYSASLMELYRTRICGNLGGV